MKRIIPILLSIFLVFPAAYGDYLDPDVVALTFARKLYEEGNYADAVKTWKTYAAKNNAISQAWLGICYMEGNGVIKNYDEAVRWFRKAAAQGHARAMYELANCYNYGKGVPQDFSKAAEWYRKAMENSDNEKLKSISTINYRRLLKKIPGSGLSETSTQ